jgi:ABC-type glutathione transport system ATPase component
MLIVEHDVGLLMDTCERLIAMDLGRVIADGDPRDVIRDPAVLASYFGRSSKARTSRGTGTPRGQRSPSGPAAGHHRSLAVARR